jgi:hypothetical protein
MKGIPQGDKIGRIFALWATVNFGRFFNHIQDENFLETHPPKTKAIRHVSTLTWVLFRCSFTTEVAQTFGQLFSYKKYMH